MNFSDLLNDLSNWDKFPIVPDVLEEIIIRKTDIEEILFIGVNINTSILKGGYINTRYEYLPSDHIPGPYALSEEKIRVRIYYADNQSEEWIRLVINKELIHILDPDRLRTATPEELRTLVSNLRIPRELQLAAGRSHHAEECALVDYLTDYRAVAVMVPESIRLLYLEKYKEGKITEKKISELFGIPIDYVFVLMSDIWSEIRSVLCTI